MSGQDNPRGITVERYRAKTNDVRGTSPYRRKFLAERVTQNGRDFAILLEYSEGSASRLEAWELADGELYEDVRKEAGKRLKFYLEEEKDWRITEDF